MDKNKAVIIGVLVALVGALGFMKYSEAPPELESHNDAATAATAKKSDEKKTDGGKSGAPSTPAQSAAGLKKIDLKVGTGKEAKTGDHVTVHYIGTLTNGTKFDASRDHGKPFDFDLGAGSVIKGWDLGVVGMKEGGKRKLVIPGDLAYGPNPPPGSPITPNATLVFVIDLLKVG